MFYVILKNIKEVAPVKTIIYSPSEDMTDENTFFESMEAATEAGGDILIFPENVYTPYNKFLNSVDILSADEYDTVLDCLYEFCTELGCAAVFNATDDFGELAASPYSWTSSSSGFGTNNNKSITTSGTYTAYVRDAAGNVGSCSTYVRVDSGQVIQPY